MIRSAVVLVLVLATGCGESEVAPGEVEVAGSAAEAAASEDAHGIVEPSVSIETPGNLASEKPLDCVAAAEVTSTHTPADIYPAVADCLRQKRLSDAISLYTIAYAYSTFDMQRVTDPTAHQAKTVLEMQAFGPLSEVERAELISGVQATAPGTEASVRVCDDLRKLGPPTYEPTYMIQHGMAAVQGEAQAGTPADFDAAKAWADVLANRMKCS